MEDRRRVLGDTVLAALGVGLLAAAVALWLGVLTDPGPTRVDGALACARASDGADGSIAHCYTVRGLPVPDDL